MFKSFSKTITMCLIFLLGISFAAYGKQADPNRKNLKLGCLAYSEPMMQWIKEGLEPLGYKIEIVMFDANQLPATALKDGNVDGIIANHRPWMLTFNKENNCDLEMVKPYYFYSFFAIYSTKHKKLNEIPQNATITIPGDPTNLSRSLIILKEAGLITLGEKKGVFYTIIDIKDNPKKIKFIEAEITQTARSIHDVDAVIATAYFISAAAKLNPRVFLFEDPQNQQYAIGLIVKREDINSPWAKEAMKILKKEKNKARFNEKFKGQYFLID
jgi:D-methionine transport system substrate-binding protein